MSALKPTDIQDIMNFAKEHPLGKLLTEMKNWQFSVGDTLIRFKKMPDGHMQLDNVSDKCPVPKKFKVIHVDDLGLPWVRQLSVRGGLGSTLYCLANNSVELYRYQVDPEQLDSILLGTRYDPRAEYRNMRENNPNYGGNNTPEPVTKKKVHP